MTARAIALSCTMLALSGLLTVTFAANDPQLTIGSERCRFLSRKAIDGYHGPSDIRKEWSASFYNICLARSMPEGWPSASFRLSRGHELFKNVQRKTSKLADPEAFGFTFFKVRESL